MKLWKIRKKNLAVATTKNNKTIHKCKVTNKLFLALHLLC